MRGTELEERSERRQKPKAQGEEPLFERKGLRAVMSQACSH